MPDTESPPKLMRRLDYSSALDDENDGGGGGGAASASTKSPPQHVNQNNSEHTYASPLPTTPQSRSRGTLSSRTSVLGRRLAEERSRNHQLSEELKHMKSLLEREMKRNNDDIAVDLNESFYSSSPVTTPSATPVKYRGGLNIIDAAEEMDDEGNKESNNDNMNMQRIQELEFALQIETKLRKDAQAKLAEAEQNSNIFDQKAMDDTLQIGIDSPIHEYLQRASHLIDANTDGSDPLPSTNGYSNGTHHTYNPLESIDEDDEEEEDEADDIPADTSLSNIVHKMQEYEELVTAFHSEQQMNRDEVISKEDVLWFFEELKWRFADIHRGVVAVSKEEPKGSNVQDSSEEWKNCLIGLVDELEYSMKKTKEQTNVKVKANLVDDESVAAMKLSYEEQLATQSQRIDQLEADALEQEGHFKEMQDKMTRDSLLIEEEREKLSLSKDGTAARIRYLESMVQSLQVKVKNTQANLDTGKGKSIEKTDSKTSNYASEIDSLAKALEDSELKRAQLIDDFQAEREKFITQYKQMNDVLKQFIGVESKHS